MRSIALILAAAAPLCAQSIVNPTGQFAARPPVQPTAFDCAADGSVVNAVTGEPVARAHVNIFVGDYTYSTATAASGAWGIANMACAQAQMQVSRPGFLQTLPSRPNQIGPFRPLTLASGSPVHDIRTELTPQSAVYGKVVDDQGDPVMNALILPLVSRVVDGRAVFQQQGAGGGTNDLGEFRISGLVRGKYIFCLHAPQPIGPVGQALQGSQTMPADSCYPGVPDGGVASAMDLPAGREAKIDFTISEVPAVHVRGSVVGLPEGRGSGLRIIRRGVEFGAALPGNVRDGKFDFRVPPGAYILAGDYFENGMRLTARVPVDVGNADVDNIVVHLESGFTVTGVAHAVSQSGQNAPQQFAVSLRSSDPGVIAGQMKWEINRTSFSINEMTPGSYRLQASPPPPFYVKSATLAGQDILNDETPISQAAGPIDIQLRDDGGSIEGDVVDSNSQAVPSSVMLLRGSTRAASLTTQNGHFKLQNLAPGDYMIYAWDNPDNVQYADPDWMRRNGTGGAAVTVASAQTQQVKLIQQSVPE